MPALDPAVCIERLAASDHGVLVTNGEDGYPNPVPVCFVVVGDHLVIPLDTVKPKTARRLQRERDVEHDRRASFLVEHWHPDDWRQLWWARLDLQHVALPDTVAAHALVDLAARYPQYEGGGVGGVLGFTIERAAGWSAAGGAL